jgi:hypothetical protein
MKSIITRNRITVKTLSCPIFTKLNKLPVALGIPAIIEVAIINDNPLPIPLFVICSPSHITKKVPAVSVMIVRIKKLVPGLNTISAPVPKPVCSAVTRSDP